MRSEVYRGTNDSPLIRANIQHLELRDVDHAAFTVPEDYIDMRDSAELERQFGTAPPFE